MILMNTENNSSSKRDANFSIKDHTKNCLNELLSKFNDKKIGLKKLSQKTGVHERTLNRLLNNENKPNYQTINRIYKYYYNEFQEQELLKLVPLEVRDYLIKFSVQQTDEKTIHHDFVDKKIQENPVLAEIYILIGMGPVTQDEIELRFGQYGLSILSELLSENIVKKTEGNIYLLGERQALYDIPTILKTGLIMARNHFNIENAYVLDQNHIGFLAESLTDEEYHQWLTIDQEAYLKKAEIMKSKKSNGTNRAYTFMITDKVTPMENL